MGVTALTHGRAAAEEERRAAGGRGTGSGKAQDAEALAVVVTAGHERSGRGRVQLNFPAVRGRCGWWGELCDKLEHVAVHQDIAVEDAVQVLGEVERCSRNSSVSSAAVSGAAADCSRRGGDVGRTTDRTVVEERGKRDQGELRSLMRSSVGMVAIRTEEESACDGAIRGELREWGAGR